VRCRPGGSGRKVITPSDSLEDVLRARLGTLGVPVVYGLRFGHSTDKMTLPLGVMASLEAAKDNVVFRIIESGLS